MLESVPTTLPSTPSPSPSLFLQEEKPAAPERQSETHALRYPVTQVLKNHVLCPSSLKSRRHASLPVSSITADPVLAPHFSNPSTSHQTNPRSPTAPAAEQSDKLLKSTSIRELRELTSSVTAGSRSKNTPPLTPRALSHEEGYQGRRSPLSGANTIADGEKPSQKSAWKTTKPASNGEALPTNSPKGKLLVKIDEARGLTPSYDPYVVCVFEWNEYISRGPKHDAMDLDHVEEPAVKSRKDAISAMPVRRTDSEVGKPTE